MTENGIVVHSLKLLCNCSPVDRIIIVESLNYNLTIQLVQSLNYLFQYEKNVNISDKNINFTNAKCHVKLKIMTSL